MDSNATGWEKGTLSGTVWEAYPSQRWGSGFDTVRIIGWEECTAFAVGVEDVVESTISEPSMAEGEENDCKRREKGTGARVSAVEKRETQARVPKLGFQLEDASEGS